MIDLLNYFQKRKKKFFSEGLMTNYGGNEADGAEKRYVIPQFEDTSFFSMNNHPRLLINNVVEDQPGTYQKAKKKKKTNNTKEDLGFQYCGGEREKK